MSASRTCNAISMLALDQYERYVSALDADTRVTVELNPGGLECELSPGHRHRHATCVAAIAITDPASTWDTEREIWALWGALEPPELVTVEDCAANKGCTFFAGHGGDCSIQDGFGERYEG